MEELEMNFGKIYLVIGLIFVTVALLILAGSSYQKSVCNEVCDEQQALGYLVVPSGKWFDLGKDDTCLCFYKDRIEKVK